MIHVYEKKDYPETFNAEEHRDWLAKITKEVEARGWKVRSSETWQAPSTITYSTLEAEEKEPSHATRTQ
jgi:hypothetical protein